jgi:hypothetical protein
MILLERGCWSQNRTQFYRRDQAQFGQLDPEDRTYGTGFVTTEVKFGILLLKFSHQFDSSKGNGFFDISGCHLNKARNESFGKSDQSRDVI